MRVSVRGDLLREERRCLLGGRAGAGGSAGCASAACAACLPGCVILENIPEVGCLRLDLRSPRAAHGRGEPQLSLGACG